MKQWHSGKGDNVAGNKIVTIDKKVLYAWAAILLLALFFWWVNEQKKQVVKSEVSVTDAYAIEFPPSDTFEPKTGNQREAKPDSSQPEPKTGNQREAKPYSSQPEPKTGNQREAKPDSYQTEPNKGSQSKAKLDSYQTEPKTENQGNVNSSANSYNDFEYIFSEKITDYDFPEIMFSLKNSGNVAAFISEFQIELSQLKLDLTPDISITFWYCEGEKNPTLICDIENNGWGDARKFNLEINNGIRSFESFTSKISVVKKASSFNIFEIPISNYNFVENPNNRFNLKMTYEDENGKKYTKNYVASIRKICCDCVYSNAPPDAMYIALFKLPDNRPLVSVTNKYKIQREVPVKGNDVFKIKIGTNRSYSFFATIKFRVDDYWIKSDTFTLKTWNPHGSYLNEEYRDGQIIIFK